MFPCGTSLCPCKQEAFNRAAGKQCVALQNWTVGVDGTCQNAQCSPGHRLFQTGSSLSCIECSAVVPNLCNNLTLYETACQGYLHEFLSVLTFRVLRGGVCGMRQRASEVHGVPGNARGTAQSEWEWHPAVS
jgi:hypothetical protein